MIPYIKIFQPFFFGNRYVLRDLNINGQHIQINYIVRGKNDHLNKVFNCHSGCVVWPNGKIKIETPLIRG